MDARARALASPPLFAVVAALATLSFAGPARADVTEVIVNPTAAGAPYEARYSQGLVLEARLTANGVPVDGSAYDPPLRIVFSLAPADAPDDAFVIEDPVVDASGFARARLALVDGLYGGQEFTGGGTTSATAFPYTITAEFLGRSPPPLGECQPTDGGAATTDDAGTGTRLCAATGTGQLRVTWELPTLEMDPVDEALLGETVTLIASLADPTGDALAAGNELDGPGPKPLEGGTISFFYDVDGNGQPSLNERLGTSTTSAQGIATFEFELDPQFVRAGDYEAGLHVQYAGDQRRYTIAGDASRFSVLAGDPDPTKSIIEAAPATLPADGFSTTKITVKLVDASRNVLDVNAEDFDVVLQTDLGTLVDTIERDPVTGFYVQELKAGRAGGVARVQAMIEGAPGPTVEVELVKEGCACVTTGSGPAPAALSLLAPLLLLARRRR